MISRLQKLPFLHSPAFWLWVIIGLGAGMRFWLAHLNALWHDEAFTVLLVRQPWSHFISSIIADVHPPLYYLLMRLWILVFGQSVIALRGFSILGATVSIYLIYKLALQLTKQVHTALLAALFVAINPFYIHYSIEGRMYSLATALVIASSILLLRALQNNRLRFWIAYGVITGLSALTHYFLFFSIFAQTLFVFIMYIKQGRFRQLWKPGIAYAVALVIFLPWLPSFWQQVTRVETKFWVEKTSTINIALFLWKVALGPYLGDDWGGVVITHIVTPAIFLTLVALGFGVSLYWAIFFQKQKHLFYPIFLSAVPFFLTLVISLKVPLFNDRYLLFATIFGLLLLAIIITTIPSKKIRVAIIVSVTIIQLASYELGQSLFMRNKPGMQAVGGYMTSHVTSQDSIIVASPFLYLTYQYYTLPPISSLTKPQPLLYIPGMTGYEWIPHYFGTPLFSNDDFTADLTALKPPSDVIWVVWTDGFQSKDLTPYIPHTWRRVNQVAFADIKNYRGTIYVTEYRNK